MELVKYLHTGKRQIDVAKQILEVCDKEFGMVIGNYERHKAHITILIVYTQDDITELLKKHIRATDMVQGCKIGDAYLSVVFLTFTDMEGGYCFATFMENNLQNEQIEYRFFIDELNRAANANPVNFIDNFLFEIENQATDFSSFLKCSNQ